jgi:sulfotransferase family protein
MARRTHVAEPVVILALPRSYSSLACAMLGQHPQMYDTLETQLFEVDTLREWWQCYGDIHDSDGLTRVLAEVLMGDQSAESAHLIRSWLWQGQDWTTGEIAWMLAERLSPLRMVEKTPIESESPQVIRQKLQRRLQVFPKARFLHLVRNPLTYGKSHLEHLEKMGKTAYPWRMTHRYRMMLDTATDPPVVDPQVLWLRVNSLVREFLENLPGGQKLLVRGEDLVSDPDKELRKIASWLGIRSDSRAIEEMKHPERSPFACVGPHNAMFGGDPTFFSAPELRVGKPARDGLAAPLPWREDGVSFSQEVVQLARQFGY